MKNQKNLISLIKKFSKKAFGRQIAAFDEWLKSERISMNVEAWVSKKKSQIWKARVVKTQKNLVNTSRCF